jgi:membrane fusion protein, multidrug efflux system
MRASSSPQPLTQPGHRTDGPAGAAGPSARARWLGLVGSAAAVLAAVLAAGCNQASAPAQPAKPPEVVVTTPITDDVTDYQDFTGRLEAVKMVEIRARVAGYVMEVPFKEGDRVREGDVLFQIDPREYQAQFEANKARVAQGEAALQLARANYQRFQALFKKNPGAVSQADLDRYQAEEAQGLANLNLAKANLESARLNLEWTKVTAPVTGRVSRRFVDPGNLVVADQTMLTTIVTENPLYAYFDVDERTYLDLVDSHAPGQDSMLEHPHFPVLMRLANQDDFKGVGRVDFIDNRVTATSGTVRMRGVFANPQGTLKAGLFVRVRLPIGKPYEAILVPDEALQSDQGRKYVYVVNGKNEVEYRAVELGQALQGLRVIKKGLAQGERVIVSGMQRVRPKVEVHAKAQDPPKKPDSPLSRLMAAVGRQESGAPAEKAGGRDPGSVGRGQ